MQKPSLKISSTILCAFLLSACQTSPPNIPVCTEITMNRGWCINTISGDGFDVDDSHPMHDDEKGTDVTWWDARPTMILVPYWSWSKLKKYIINQCKQTGTCDAAIASWDRTIESLDQVVKEK